MQFRSSVVLPAHSVFFRPLGIHDDLLADAVFPFGICNALAMFLCLSSLVQNSAHRGTAGVELAGDLGFIEAGAAKLPNLIGANFLRMWKPFTTRSSLPVRVVKSSDMQT
jgi:hypothetical protein